MAKTLEEKAKEIPGAIENDTGMRKLYGYMKSHRYHVYVPTTIFEPKVAIIKVYNIENPEALSDVPETVIREEYVRLASMPTWDVEYRCIQLSKRDQQKVSKVLKNLEKRLEPNQ